MRISTKRGDKGFSSLADGKKIKKSAEVFEVLGGLDELDSFIGWGKVAAPKSYKKVLEQIQKTLYEIMVGIGSLKKIAILKNEILFLEKTIEALEKNLSVLNKFVMPGKNEASARMHIARVICRKIERIIARNTEKLKIPDDLLAYMNRLSDLLFLMAEKF